MTLADKFARANLCGGPSSAVPTPATNFEDPQSRLSNEYNLLDLIPAVQEAKFPMLHSRQRLIDDLLLQEVFLNLLHSELELQTFYEWRTAPQHCLLLNIAGTGPELVGGMLLAERYFLFDEMPFVRFKVRDVRCRLDLSTLLHPVPPGGAFASAQEARRASGVFGGAVPASTAMSKANDERLLQLQKLGISTTGRVHFRVEEYECTSMSWVVQRFQLLDANNNVVFGNVLTRAFNPDKTLSQGTAVAPTTTTTTTAPTTTTTTTVTPAPPPVPTPAPAVPVTSMVSDTTNESTMMGASMIAPSAAERVFARASRKAVPGEERLRVLKPWLYEWCLARSPSDMGAAATSIKEALLYFRHTFSVVRTIRQLVSAVRCVQQFVRRMLSRKKAAMERMLAEWSRREVAILNQLNNLNAKGAAMDPIERVVNEVLQVQCRTTVQEKKDLIALLHARHLTELREKRRTRAQFYIPAEELLYEFEQQLLDRLGDNGASPIFEDERVRRYKHASAAEVRAMLATRLSSRK